MSDQEIFPERITVTKSVTYDVETVRQNILSDNRASDNDELEITMEDIIELIQTYALDDLSCGWGHQANLKELIFQDENGEEY